MQTAPSYIRVDRREGTAPVPKPAGLTRVAQVQQRLIVMGRLLLPVGTYGVSNIGQVYEGPTRDVFQIFQTRKTESITYDVSLARFTAPRRERIVHVTNYTVTPAVAALAQQILGREYVSQGLARAYEQLYYTRVPAAQHH